MKAEDVSDDLITVTVRRHDLEEAITSIEYAHSDYCVSSDHCDCNAISDRLQQALDHYRKDSTP